MSFTTRFEPLVIDDYKELFRDEASYNTFCARLLALFGRAASPVIVHGNLIGVAVSPEDAKNIIINHVVKSWEKDPCVLDKLRNAINSDADIPAPELALP